ncbi:MAG: tetratricopeptide repeat protein [Proteobacteria bacterium]|nr:tetratricopeptide repeat protein [Pseudomonadota bacterium]
MAVFGRLSALISAAACVFLFTVGGALAAGDYEAGKKARANQDFVSAVKAFRKGIAKGDKKSANALGEMYVLGLGVEKDAVTACQLFLKGAKLGDPMAQHNYAVCSAKGKTGKPNPAEAAKWYDKAIAGGHNPALCALGDLYASGSGVAKDAKRGFDLCLKGAMAGETKAAARVGELYLAGIGTAQNLKEAFKWLKKAGDKQDPSATYNLGLMHLRGDGVPKSLDKARRWFTVSALRRHRVAYEPAATLYRDKVIALLKKEKIDVRMTRWAIFFLTLAKSIQTTPKQKSNYSTLIDQFSQLSPTARRLADQDLVKWNANKL